MTDKLQKEKILFICTRNSARSQISEGFLRFKLGDRYEIFNPGNSPTVVSSYTIEVMREIGIDISNQSSKSIELYFNDKFDRVITLCDKAREKLSLFPYSW